MKFTITSMLIVTFWCAAVFAGLTIVSQADAMDGRVVEFMGHAYSILATAFLFYSLFSAVYGPRIARPFWVGCTCVCFFATFVELLFPNGISHCVAMLATDFAGRFALHRPGLETTERIIHYGMTPLLALVGGILCQSIAHETEKAEQESEARN